MSDTLLKTKLAIPLVRADRIARPRLIEKLNAGLMQEQNFARKLILISAPAGFGKTTLAADWLSSAGLHASWLSLDEGDNDPARFLAYLLAALQQVDARIGVAARAMLQSPQPLPGEVILTTLINDLAEAAEPLVLTLDDYHAIQNPQIHRQVGFLLERQPATLLLVILTREDPLLPVVRLRSRGQVCEIRESDLRFTLSETASYLSQVMRLDLGADDLATLQGRTEGWATGLQLVALSMQGSDNRHQFIQSFAGSNRYILDYLFEEIFSRQAAETQEFLIRTSVLDRLTGGLCDALTGRDDSREQLTALERANLFIAALDPAREWYRYHHLFSDLLRHQLRLRKDLSEAALHIQASRWYEGQGFLADAIQHALAAQDWSTAARLIGKASEGMLKRGELATLIRWYGMLPRQVACAQHELCMAFAWALLLASQFDPAEDLLERAEKTAPASTPQLGQVAAAQAYLARSRGDNPRLIEKSQLALDLLPKDDWINRGNVAVNLGIACWHAGRLDEAEPALREAVESAGRVGNFYTLLAGQTFLARTLASRGYLRQAEGMLQKLIQEGGSVPILAVAHYDLGAIYYEWNQLDKAGEHVGVGLEMSAQSGNAEFQNAGQLLRASLALAQGNPAGALEAIEQSHQLARDYASSTQARSAACHARIALALGNLGEAARWGEQAADEVDAHPFYRFLGLTRPRLLIASGQREAAAALLGEKYEQARRAGWGYALITVRILQALAAEPADGGLEFLADALDLAQPEGYLRAFVDEGRGLVPLLQKAAVRGIQAELVGQILAAMGEERAWGIPEQSQLAEPLSERELEVLRLVVAGLSNREIARQLFISPGTAKTHIHNVCGKLGARNRTEAATRAKELKLV